MGDKNLTVEATWEGGYRCTVATRQFRIRIDEPEKAGGEDTGPQPSEVFLASLAGCFTLALYHVARKRDIQLPDITVTATGTYEGPGFARLAVAVNSSADRQILESLLEPAKRVCYVSNTLRNVSDVEVTLGQKG
ncbi:MAG: OsmC family protein [Actinomycetota bacterium]